MSVLTQKRSFKVFKDDMVFFGMNKITALTHFLEIRASFDCSFPLKANVGLHCLRHATCTDLTAENIFLRENMRAGFKWRLKPQAQNKHCNDKANVLIKLLVNINDFAHTRDEDLVIIICRHL